ncbi:MAG TPA: SDR family NAD(P)-dependent oxidoreductase [Bryobacteraceae bacterium]|jgi:NAD(P)-dependent dehydrogenase (short-subunit alcohol dehydrogenase family)|nr:SDR family NAD(P)-dependent oxidoreductase [Bryobacteraceae bacterium]
MKDFKGKVAVVTGAASGIGRGIAQRCVAEGMRVVLADIEKDALEEAAAAMPGTMPYRVDVSYAPGMDAMADAVYKEFGAVHLLFNNAGVAPDGKMSWAQTLETWKWVIDVNLYGVIHGLRSFVPRMLAGGEEGYVVNTASVAGLHSGPMISPYYATKHAVVGLSECLYLELKMANARIGAAVLCPAFVKTRIAESWRNRPGGSAATAAGSDEFGAMVRGLVEQGVSPESIADKVFEAIREERLWILTHPEFDAAIRDRAEGMLEGRNPLLRAT